jgi:hypothetical protein
VRSSYVGVQPTSPEIGPIPVPPTLNCGSSAHKPGDPIRVTSHVGHMKICLLRSSCPRAWRLDQSQSQSEWIRNVYKTTSLEIGPIPFQVSKKSLRQVCHLRSTGPHEPNLPSALTCGRRQVCSLCGGSRGFDPRAQRLDQHQPQDEFVFYAPPCMCGINTASCW